MHVIVQVGHLVFLTPYNYDTVTYVLLICDGLIDLFFSQATTPSHTRWDDTPGHIKGSETPGATPGTRIWEATPSHTPGHVTPGKPINYMHLYTCI